MPPSYINFGEESPEIIVVGAGAAGLACASKLVSMGFNKVRVLEAEDRIGGRIYTIPFGSNVIDLGAQWVHGERGNIIYDMVKDFQLLDSSGNIYSNVECIRSNGEVVSQKIISRLKHIVENIFKSRLEELSKYDGSFGEFLTEEFNRAMSQPDMKDIDSNVAEEFLENIKKMESSETTVGLDEVSAKSVAEYWKCAGDYMLNWKGKGFITFLRLLIDSNDEHIFGKLEGRIEFNRTVEQILWDNPNAKAFVKCENNDELLEADHVIITVSLGVLKERMDSMFQPPLPVSKKRAIIALGYGSIGKIFLEFPTKFWPDDWTGFTTLWCKDDVENMRRTKYAWLVDIFGLYCVTYQPRVLLGWMIGPDVVGIENLPKEILIQGCMMLLRRFLPNWHIPEPIAIQASHWQSNRNFCGAYAFRSMASEELNAMPWHLSTPLFVVFDANSISLTSTSSSIGTHMRSKPVIQFAGEATSNQFATVHGAVESGLREAFRLYSYYCP